MQPLARLLAGELSAKLEADIGIDLGGLYAHDLAGRAQAFGSMVTAGIDVTKAAALARLLEVEN